SCDKENLEIKHTTSFNFEIAIDINPLSGDPKTITDIIIEAVQNADEYKWR
ncbi:6692_t:CDS:1, partial [Funneliformis mosseae]